MLGALLVWSMQPAVACSISCVLEPPRIISPAVGTVTSDTIFILKMPVAQATDESIRLFDEGGEAVEGMVSPFMGSRSDLVLRPAAPLAPGRYTLEYDDGQDVVQSDYVVEAAEAGDPPAVQGLEVDPRYSKHLFKPIGDVGASCGGAGAGIFFDLSWFDDYDGAYAISWFSSDGSGHEGLLVVDGAEASLGRDVCADEIPDLQLGDEVEFQVQAVGLDGSLGPAAIRSDVVRRVQDCGCAAGATPFGAGLGGLIGLAALARRRRGRYLAAG